ncbi:hypothetical protein L210DRAFT_2471323 [Boletus edulis BED1]|uniref:Uncharacterized protein n=1 Tax=Boletus edulis BED1 TaxID=1328754 RepID=A0AAD4G6C2_BOLED|nr:hypothetical protein L210DRAFT_2471323 [Boletus edulis BED1]
MDRRSLFSQDSNLAVFEPFISAIQQSLSHNGSSASSLPFTTQSASCSPHHNSQAIHDWFELDHQIQNHLCAALIQTIGVPPRDFQIAIFQYDHDAITGSARNLFLMDGMVALGNPKAKQHVRIVQECIWQVQPSLAKAILFYLGALRPVVVHFIGVLFPSSRHLYHHHNFCIFVHNTLVGKRLHHRRGIYLWNGSKVNRALQGSTSTFPIRTTCRFFRDLITAILRLYFPKLQALSKTGPVETISDIQGQHTVETSSIHYGRSSSVLFALRMPESHAREFMQVSRAYQVILGLVQLDEDTTRLYVNPQMLESDRNKDSACNIARRLVCQHYHIGSRNTPEDNSEIVTSLLTNLPYYGTLDSNKVSPIRLLCYYYMLLLLLRFH